MTQSTFPEFRTAWEGAFGPVLPMGHVLRAALPSRWMRFHALPASRRYANSADEMTEILTRANALAASCFAPGASIWLASCRFPDADPHFHLTPRYRVPQSDPDGAVEVLADQFTWRAGALDKKFREIADDEGRLLMFEPTTALVLAPYDGGFDLFDADISRCTARRDRFKAWLSDRDDGL